MDSNLLAVCEGEMSTIRHVTAWEVFRLWCGGRDASSYEAGWIVPAIRACDLVRDDLAIQIGVTHSLPSCPDCAVLRDYAEENASAT